MLFSEKITLPTNYGIFKCICVREESGVEHLILFKGRIKGEKTLVRIHSACLTGDLFQSLKCDCGSQLNNFLELMQNNENAMLIYMNQEGRGIGLFNKIRAYKLQEEGLNTFEANLALGFKEDCRDYNAATEIILKFAPLKIKLVTNNPEKLYAITNGTNIGTERISINIKPNNLNKDYLLTKKLHMEDT